MRSHPTLDAAASRGVKLGLDRVAGLLHRLGDPHLGRTTVHVAGTNGKGSTCTMVAAGAREAGLRVGVFLSPHLVHVNERIVIDGDPIEDGALDRALGDVIAAAQQWSEDVGDEVALPTYFELTMIAAFVAFERAGVAVQVIETGIGGRLDATNVVRPDVVAITSVGWDHQDVLGDTIEAIATEKAGIVKPGSAAVVGSVPQAARRAIAAQAARVGVVPWWVGETIQVTTEGADGRVTTPLGTLAPMRPAMAGPHQLGNAAVAGAVLQRLAHVQPRITPGAIVRGVAGAVLGGRTEQVARGVWVDGAHNADGAAALAATLAAWPRPAHRLLVFGCGGHRDPTVLLAPLVPWVDGVVVSRAPHPAAQDPERVAQAARSLGLDAVVREDPRDAVLHAQQAADEVVVAGSLYLVGAVVDGIRGST